jgi:hypothetical protein
MTYLTGKGQFSSESRNSHNLFPLKNGGNRWSSLNRGKKLCSSTAKPANDREPRLNKIAVDYNDSMICQQGRPQKSNE